MSISFSFIIVAILECMTLIYLRSIGKKVREGIRKQIKYLVESDEKDSHSHRMIGDDSKEHFTEDEWSAYQIIKEFRDNKCVDL